MKKIFLIVLMVSFFLVPIAEAQVTSQLTVRCQSSGLKNSDSAISIPQFRKSLCGVLLITDGANDASIIVYDNANAASGKVLFKGTVAGSGSYADLDIDYNLYYPDGNLWLKEGAAAKSFADWKTWLSDNGVDGADAHSSVADPLFTNAGGTYQLVADYKLQTLSPAINAGVNVGLTMDYEGNSVPQGAGFDIGAYEFLIHGRIKGGHGKGFKIK